MGKFRVLIAEPHEDIREGLAEILGHEFGGKIEVHTAANIVSLSKKLSGRLSPHLVVMEHHLGPRDEEKAAFVLGLAKANSSVIAMSTDPSVVGLYRHADFFFHKPFSLQAFIGKIRLIAFEKHGFEL